MRGTDEAPKSAGLLNEEFMKAYESVMEYAKKAKQYRVESSLHRHKYRFVSILHYMQEQGKTRFEDIEFNDYLQYIYSLEDIPMWERQRHLGAIKLIAEWSHLTLDTPSDIIHKLNLITVARRKPTRQGPDPYTDKEISQMFKSIDEKWPYTPMSVDRLKRGIDTGDWGIRRSMMNVQMKALIWLLLETGLRKSEAHSLTIDDVDPINDRIRVIGKGDKERTVPYTQKARDEMRKWIAHREILVDRGERYLWVSLWGAHYRDPRTSRPATLAAFEVWPTRVLVGKKGKRNEWLKFHRIRKTFATACYEEGLDVGVISKLLGHDNIATTSFYLGIDEERVFAESAMIEEQRAQRYEKAASASMKGRSRPEEIEEFSGVLRHYETKEVRDD